MAIIEVKEPVKLEAEQNIPEHVAGIQMSNLPQFRYNSLSKLYHLFVNTLAKCYCFDLLQ